KWREARARRAPAERTTRAKRPELHALLSPLCGTAAGSATPAGKEPGPESQSASKRPTASTTKRKQPWLGNLSIFLIRIRRRASSMGRKRVQFQASRDALRDFRFQIHVLRIAYFGTQHAAQGMDQRQGTPFGQGHMQGKTNDGIKRQSGVNAAKQLIEAFGGEGGNQRGRPLTVAVVPASRFQLRALIGVQAVHLVEDAEARRCLYTEVIENSVHFRVQLVVMRVRDVAHLQEQRRFLHLFERGTERGNQAFRELANESHGIRNQDAAIRWQAYRANGRV